MVNVAKFQRLQNSAARLISLTSRFHHITPVMKSLPWLSVKYRILFKFAILTFKISHGLSPDYLKELVTIKEVCRYNLLFNNGLHLELPPITHKRHWVIAPIKWQLRPYGTNSRTTEQYKTKLLDLFFQFINASVHIPLQPYLCAFVINVY